MLGEPWVCGRLTQRHRQGCRSHHSHLYCPALVPFTRARSSGGCLGCDGVNEIESVGGASCRARKNSSARVSDASSTPPPPPLPLQPSSDIAPRNKSPNVEPDNDPTHTPEHNTNCLMSRGTNTNPATPRYCPNNPKPWRNTTSHKLKTNYKTPTTTHKQ
ncbi:hypothetical protein GWK47_040656 [Chionoecetes opilio]|uniref:Uncharacterized protein n=1 Tax=Chionoecetes opilio TaxID=41210 RepID=A0A8J4YQ18_CHIOP|nr:hypothetical protein GWK47_040656 [Chionoecetes opilio]